MGFSRLDRFVRAVEEQSNPEADFAAVIRHEHAISPAFDGRSVDRAGKHSSRPDLTQLPLFDGLE